MAGRTKRKRTNNFGLYLDEVSIEDSLNGHQYFPAKYVPGMLDFLQSPNVRDGFNRVFQPGKVGTGEKVDDLYQKIVLQYNSDDGVNRRRESPLIAGGKNARILDVRYRLPSESHAERPTVLFSFPFKEFVRLGRPFYFMGKKTVVESLRAVKELDSKYR